MNTRSQKFLPYFMWALPLLFFAGQFILRLSPSLMMQDIMKQFAIDAGSFGLLASAYYYGYSGMLIPIAFALERFGTRNTVCALAFITGLAVLLFTYTTSWPLAILARFLIGAGSAVGFLGVSKVISEWFVPEKYTHMVGLTFSFGLLGAVYGGRPTSYLVDLFGGTAVWTYAGIISCLIGVLVFIFLRKPAKSLNAVEEPPLRLTDMKAIIKSKPIWLLAIANLLMVGVLEGFADVWGVSYLVSANHFTKGLAAQLTSFIFVGMIFGGPILAHFSNKFGQKKVIQASGIGMALGLFYLLSFTNHSVFTLTALFLTLGIFCCYQVIVFSLGTSLVNPKLLGITVAFLNCINMLGGSFFHTTIGTVMDMFWTGGMENGIRTYSEMSYKYGLSIIPISALIGVVLIYFIRYSANKKEVLG